MDQPPRAKQIPKKIIEHGTERIDEYYWLRERENPDVHAYLEAENAYVESVMGGPSDLREKLFQELKGRLQEDDCSVPYKDGDYYYYVRTEAGKQYPIFCRKRGSLEAGEEVMLDENEVAAGHPYASVAFVKVSPDHAKLAYAVDFEGDERHELRVIDLATRALLGGGVSDVDYSLEWANDSATFFYTVADTLRRPYTVRRCVLGAADAGDVLVFAEPDDRFFVSLSKTRSGRFICIELHSQITSEVHLLEANAPGEPLRLVAPRRQGHEYSVEHRGDELLILTNAEAKNFRLVAAPIETPAEAYWREVIAHRDDVMLEGVEAFQDFIVIHELSDALRTFRIRPLEGDAFAVALPETVYALGGGPNPDYTASTFRFTYSSLVTPHTTYDFDTRTRILTLVKREEVLSGYDPAQYVVERTYATAPDGARIPLSLAYKRGAKMGENPCWLYGYGSYGSVASPAFSESNISLMDRGFVCATAHVRGGGELGRLWYEAGKFLSKKNTFTDFIACAEHLIEERYCAKERLVIAGRSAGGLLVGVVVNLRPDLFCAAIADVPFVDVVGTMMDPSLPLTVIEYEEWGDPNERVYHDYLSSYAPYENVERQAYPHMLVTAGLNDPRVQYWEPAKWVAKLRTHKTDDHLLLFQTNMGAGHGGPSGRYDSLREVAFEFAFVFKVLDIAG